MAKIRVLATEDDPIHEAQLRKSLDVLGYELIDVLSNPEEVIPMVNATSPDILLMDIDLGAKVTGIDLVKKINLDHNIPTVYLSAFTDNETFQKAKKTIPSAYISKPYEIFALQSAIEMAVYHSSKEELGENSWDSNMVLKKHVFIKDGQSLVKVAISDIMLLEAYDKYCYIHTAEKKFMLNARLKNIISQLPSSLFCQVHRSYVVNMLSIESVQPQNNKVIIAGKEVSISKSFKHDFLLRLNSLG
jgi:DNA-binding LytR/AlgR family response regulator